MLAKECYLQEVGMPSSPRRWNEIQCILTNWVPDITHCQRGRVRHFLVSALLVTAACAGDNPAAPAPSTTSLVFSSQPTTAVAGSLITPPFQVTVRDESGAVMTGSSLTITVALTSSTGTAGAVLTGTRSKSAVNGVATFDDLTIDRQGAGYTLTATSGSLSPATSNGFTVSPRPPSKLTFVVQPTNATVGAAIAPAIQVAVQDAVGATVTGSTANVTIVLTSGTGTSGAVLGGTMTRAAVNGVATFDDLAIDRAGSGYTLTASAASLAGATSSTFGVTAPTPSNTWVTKASMPTPRAFLGVGVVNGILYAIGGEALGPGLSNVEAYDPTTNTWTAKAPMPTARRGLGVGVINGVLYAVGGDSANGWKVVTKVEAYDPLTNTWTTKAPMPTARFGLGIGVINGILYAVGGHAGISGSWLGTLEAYDPVTNTWTTKAPMPTARGDLSVGVVNGLLYAVGGENGPLAPGTVEAYDPNTNTWSTRAPLATPRAVAGAASVNGTLYAVAGTDGAVYLNSVEAYDPLLDSWSPRSPLPTDRAWLGAVELNGLLFAVGGYANVGGYGALYAYQP